MTRIQWLVFKLLIVVFMLGIIWAAFIIEGVDIKRFCYVQMFGWIIIFIECIYELRKEG